MNTPGKIVIVAALALAVAGAMILKNQRGGSSLNNTPKTTSIAVTQPLPKLLDLGADKCVPCKMMAPILEELKKEYEGRMDVEFIDVWKNPEAGKALGVELIPTQIFYDGNGKELFRHTGFFGKEDILSKWNELGVKLAEAGAGHVK
jgi:thioredoxin 1